MYGQMTPTPKKKSSRIDMQNINMKTMSIKKERKLFNADLDL